MDHRAVVGAARGEAQPGADVGQPARVGGEGVVAPGAAEVEEDGGADVGEPEGVPVGVDPLLGGEEQAGVAALVAQG